MGTVSNSNKRIVKNTVFLYIRLGIVMLVTLYTTRVVLRVLGVEDFGVYNVVGGFVSMFSVMQTTLSSGTSRFYNYKLGKDGRDSVTVVYNTSLRVQLLFALVLLVIVELVGLWYINNKLVIQPTRLHAANWIFQFSLFSMILGVLSTPYDGVILAFEKMDFTAILSIVDAVLKLLIVFLIQFSSSDKLVIYGLLMMLISLINLLCKIIYSKRAFKEVYLSKDVDKDLAKSIFCFSGWMILDPIAYTIRGQGTNMVLNYYHGPLLNAAFGISNQVNSAMDSFTSSFSGAFKPQLVQSYAENNIQRTKNLMLSMSRITWSLKVLLFVPFIFNVSFILQLWLKEVPEYTISFTVIILLVNLINTLNRPITQVIYAIGNIKLYMIITSSLVCLTLPLSILVLHFDLGPISVLWLMLAIAIINQIVSIILLSKSFSVVSIHLYFKEIIVPCFIQVLIVSTPSLVLYYLLQSGWIHLLIDCILSMTLTFLSSYLIVLSSKEKEMLISIIRNFKHKVYDAKSK